MNKKIIIILITIIILGLVIYFFIQNLVTLGQVLKYGDINESIFKCPGPKEGTDCMPPTTNKFCEPDYRNWVEENCQGIFFTD